MMQYYCTDAGRYISSAIVAVKDPDNGIHNLSYHRMQFKGGGKFGISMHTRQHLFYYYERPVRPVRIWKWPLSLGAIPPYPLEPYHDPASTETNMI